MIKIKKLEPKFVALHGVVARLDQQLGYQNKPQPDGVVMVVMSPSITLETSESGLTYSPPESVEVFGVENLRKLAYAILEFCGKNQQMVDQEKDGTKGSAL